MDVLQPSRTGGLLPIKLILLKMKKPSGIYAGRLLVSVLAHSQFPETKACESETKPPAASRARVRRTTDCHSTSLAAAGGAFVVVAEEPVPPVVVVAFGLVAPAPVLVVLEPPPLPEGLPERLSSGRNLRQPPEDRKRNACVAPLRANSPKMMA